MSTLPGRMSRFLPRGACVPSSRRFMLQVHILPDAPRDSEAAEERLHRGAEPLEIDQERVVALWRGQGQEPGVGTTRAQAVGDLLLLLQREQDVRVHADRERA